MAIVSQRAGNQSIEPKCPSKLLTDIKIKASTKLRVAEKARLR